MELLLAVCLGGLFGFALNRAGATNPQNIINMLRLNDLRLMKTIILAIGLSAIALFGGLAIGLIDPSHVSIKTAYSGVILGGILLGIGFATAGFCPGTGLAAMATGRKDALIFVIGGLVGAWAYTLSYGWIAANTSLLAPIAGGKVSLANTGNPDYAALIPQIPGVLLGMGIGLVMVVIAFLLPVHLLGKKKG
jgi:uncharacterized membrane protein YedE/YeeE